ncbi:GlxA family transcriptional regulator [Mucilaginibacter sp. L3T2-6]|uniref:GlxA family transcriptional regulator n=1 Tax=Mucilaginibacter sp. L3T2-6 TaxID=3062491 RepID=UPI0026749F99|nr:helix-turn-helix domain-containing protein [Mucilaginibacter sp. L3T2-6]MDO3643285.1 helix-turn-helix domain-containing protein [Mucilaginibacter sp. L3T2-6]MDV6215609.1 helix-turn-helix domain-containing protein [Mucilaginibacter sp. L3T2-6]
MKNLCIVIPESNSNAASIVLAYEVFAKANEYHINTGRNAVFKIWLVGCTEKTSLYNGRFTINSDINLADNPKADLIIIPTLDEHLSHTLQNSGALINWVVQQYKLGAEVASLCTGAFLLAAAGILSGKQCSTHWAAAGVFKKMFPHLDLQPDKIITDEKGVYTTGGALSSMNLVLYLVEKYYSRETAIFCAKLFQVDLGRNSQSPFTIFTDQKNHDDDGIKKAQDYMENNLQKKINIEKLASSLAIDRRNFDRRFKKATANTPAEYLQRIKIEAAKKSLETSRKNLDEIMYDVGYTDGRAFRQVFKKITGLSPAEYRNRYNKDIAVV